ncbi:MAG: hypothetical protein WAW75_00430 [Gallionella sp.]
MFDLSMPQVSQELTRNINSGKGAIKSRSLASLVLAIFLCSGFQLASAGADGHGGERHHRKHHVTLPNGDLLAVQGAIATLTDQLNALVARVSTLEERVIADENAMISLVNQINVLNVLINQNLTSITAIQNEILTLQNQNTYLTSLIATNTGDIAALQLQVSQNAALITTLEASVLLVQNSVINLGTSLQAQIDNSLVLIAALQGEIDMINSDLAFRDMLLGGICPSGEAAVEIQANGALVCAVVGGGTGGGSLTVTQFAVFQTVNIGPGASSGNIITGCPAGSVATDSGIAGADRVRINRMYTLGNTAPDNGGPLTLSSAVIRVTNTDLSLPTFVTAIVNCLQFSAVP